MFNSPASKLTPRRGPTRPRDSLSVASRATPSLFSEPHSHAPLTPSAVSRPSRLANTIARQTGSPTSSIGGETIRTTREVEGHDRITWAKDGYEEVYSLGSLPREVQAHFKRPDLVVGSVSGHVDPLTGFAFIALPNKVVAWNYQKRTHSSPTCYTFPAPPLERVEARNTPVLASIFSSSASAEPGLVIVSPQGKVRFWATLSMALAKVDEFRAMDLNLEPGDLADRIFSINSTTFVITTTAASAYRVSIGSQAGRVVPSIHPLDRPGRMFGRASKTIFPRSGSQDGIPALATNESATFLLSGNVAQKWNISSDSHRLVQEYDLHDLAGRSVFGKDWSSVSDEFALLDLAAFGQEQLAVLVSYPAEESSPPKKGRTLAILLFVASAKSNQLEFSRSVAVKYSPPSKPKLFGIPQLLIPASSPTAFIRYAEEVVVVSLARGEPYEEVISLQYAGRNAFVGVGCNTKPVTLRRTFGPTLLLMPLHGGLIAVDVSDSPRIPTDPTAILKSRMEQAVFFGDRSDNPLSFELSGEVEGDAAAAAEAISRELLSSSSPYQPALFELKPLLIDRLSRMKELMAFIRANRLLSLLPQVTRRRLSADAEKAKGAIELWDHQNKIMDQVHSRSPLSLLADSIVEYMDATESIADDDVVRGFFRSQTAHLDALLDTVFATFQAAHSADKADATGWVLEVNRIFIIVLRAASLYQEESVGMYEIDRERPPVELWTARDTIIDALEVLYTITEQTIKDRTRVLGTTVDENSANVHDPSLRKQRIDQHTLKNQLANLAAVLCTNMEDKIRTFTSKEIEGSALPAEGLALQARWDVMRPRVIRPLVGFDRVAEAYELAEHHSDFSTLVYLCHDPKSTKGEGKVQTYIERFGEDFAFVLYKWYINQGELHALMTQDEVYGALLTKFFEENEYPELAWIHHLASKRYGQAAAALVAVNTQVADLPQKHLVGSIGKLAAVVDIKARGDSTERKNQLITLDDDLELVGIQNDLAEVLSSESNGSIEAYVSACATNLDDRPAFLELFVRLADELVRGRALELEDLVDVLTLKENRGVSVYDPVVALTRLIRDTTLPEGRKQVALVSTWRRIFIRDDWNSISNTKGRSEEAQRGVLRGTLAYSTLRSITDDSRFPQSFIISPYDASTPPFLSELSARFPDTSPDDLDALMLDHETEINTLSGYIEEASLERMIREVAELVRRDIDAEQEDDEGDVEM